MKMMMKEKGRTKGEKAGMSLLFTFSLLLFTFLAGAATAPTPVQELYPFDIVGRIVNSDNVAYDATSGIRMFVTDKDGNRLVQSSVFTPSTEPQNFVLKVPLASARSPGYAVKGDAIQLTALVDGASYSGFLKPGEDAVGAPGAAVNLRILLAEDANGNGIADSYEEAMLDEMWVRELGDTYDPEADYDGDGLSNRKEYLLGTDGFDPNDCFRTATADDASGEFFAVNFEANAGRTYAVRKSSDLKDWKSAAFRLSPDSESEVKAVSNSSQQWTTRTIYLLKDGGKGFYRVEMVE